MACYWVKFILFALYPYLNAQNYIGRVFIKEFTTKYNTIKGELVNFPRSCVVVFWVVTLSTKQYDRRVPTLRRKCHRVQHQIRCICKTNPLYLFYHFTTDA